MADKSAKDQESSKDAASAAEKKPVHKQTAKTVQDGVELTWDVHREGELKPEDAADFYVSSVEALRKFKERDPRTEPLLRKAKKLKDDRDKAFSNLFLGIVVGLVLAFFIAGSRAGCADSYDSPRRSYRN
jgi:hypothetical protein